MCFCTTSWLWSIVIIAVEMMCSADSVQLKQSLVDRISAIHVGRPVAGKRRLRDLVLAGVNMNLLLSYDNQQSVAVSVEGLLTAGYRYFELIVQRHSRLLYWSTGCNTLNVREEISPALVAIASFSQQFPSDIFVLRFSLESEPELRAFSGSLFLETISACVGSRSIPATRVFESPVDELLSTQRNILVLVKNLSSMLPTRAAGVSWFQLPNIFVDDSTVRNDTDVASWNLVDRGGVVLEQHLSVDTLSILMLNWQGPDASTMSSFLSDVCHSFLPLFFMCVVVCWAVARLSVSRHMMCKVYGGLAATSAVMTLLLTVRMIQNSTSVAVGIGNVHIVNSSCAAVVDAARYWVARPTHYRLNVFVVDYRNYCCGCACSSAVGVAALANAGRIRRQVTLTHAGNPLSDAVGIRSIFACPSVLFAYVVTSRDEGNVVAWKQLSDGDTINFDEGEFPMDATVAIYVATVWNRWLHVSLHCH